jgi:hypothetical protein
MVRWDSLEEDLGFSRIDTFLHPSSPCLEPYLIGSQAIHVFVFMLPVVNEIPPIMQIKKYSNPFFSNFFAFGENFDNNSWFFINFVIKYSNFKKCLFMISIFQFYLFFIFLNSNHSLEFSVKIKPFFFFFKIPVFIILKKIVKIFKNSSMDIFSNSVILWLTVQHLNACNFFFFPKKKGHFENFDKI